MKIRLTRIPIRKVVSGYLDSQEEGVVAYGGKLNVRPKYQREFVYKDKQRDAVVDTVCRGLPLNVMYWVKTSDDNFEVLDGQQRTISICQYVNGDYSINDLYFQNLTDGEQNQILDYELMIYVCEGSDKEKLDWFKIVNIAGEKLAEQELRNAVYTGPWLADAKLKFSKTGCVAHQLAESGGSLLKGSPIRQDYLETTLKWISDNEIEDYMARHQFCDTADELWNYFQSVIWWVRAIFPNYRKEMNGIDWGKLYNEFHGQTFDPTELEAEVQRLMLDEDVTKKSGIYPYVLTRDEKHLSIRSFSPKMKREAYERQQGICPSCVALGHSKTHFEIEEMEADHIDPWHAGGKTTTENCKMLCQSCNRRKSGK